MTNQTAFNKVWKHFITKYGRRSFDDSGCRYRGGDGTKCAVGVLIPDYAYNKRMEGVGINELLHDFSHLNGLFKDVSLDFLQLLQVIHDIEWKGFIHKSPLKDLANQYKLKIPKDK